MSRFWSPIVHRLTPYIPGEQPKIPNLIKLNTNESPYGPSPRALQAIRDAAQDTLRLYPDPQAQDLKNVLADYCGLTADHLFVGNGSDEVLALAFQALLKQQQPLLFPDITYSFYPVYCQLYEVEYRQIPLTQDFSINPDDYNQPNGGIIFPNPNAPTGKALPLNAIRKLLENNPNSVVLVDEAYVDFGTESALTLIPEFPNLLVTQTFSKSWALAGLRVGFAAGHPDLIEALNRVKDSFNSYPLDRLALAGAIAAVQDADHMRASCRKVMDSREALSQALTQLGFEVLPSGANFVFARHPAHEGAWLAQQLRERALLVRHFNKPRIDAFLRITLGTPEQNQALITALQEILENS
ncbi:histidinol-phosphate transaminase [Marinospirillum alkaliphilum]|uniref:Histidinol-phosphate aminotransferase n=1 Tax=Marinospirillum alkaliphilum DSM 21637 TaxID=1122209 RepID=A0A1K1UFM6_9GAMM|nr:histidinol-phosphate transaminase [Marinospirillum alkaliphilum]SFX11873.1 histidinol phosphate aminotransferase apoenzyme [Marinospirillum alkaliphilum DSM 21637]